MKPAWSSVLLSAGMFVASASPSQALGPFFDDFESGLSLWTGRGGGGHNGILVFDPLSSGRGLVLTFSGITGGGDAFVSNPIALNGTVEVSFDYLGLPHLGGTPGDLGGFVGIAYNLTPSIEGTDHFWAAATQDAYPGLLVTLADDGAWHRYSFQFIASAPFHLMLEDFIGSGGVGQDVLFDNISIVSVPEPATGALLGLAAMLALRGGRRHYRRG